MKQHLGSIIDHRLESFFLIIINNNNNDNNNNKYTYPNCRGVAEATNLVSHACRDLHDHAVSVKPGCGLQTADYGLRSADCRLGVYAVGVKSRLQTTGEMKAANSRLVC